MDPLNTEFDQYTGQWAVYATRDLYRDGKVLAAKGDKLAGNGFDGSKLGGELFTATADANGQVTVEATEAYRASCPRTTRMRTAGARTSSASA